MLDSVQALFRSRPEPNTVYVYIDSLFIRDRRTRASRCVEPFRACCEMTDALIDHAPLSSGPGYRLNSGGRRRLRGIEHPRASTLINFECSAVTVPRFRRNPPGARRSPSVRSIRGRRRPGKLRTILPHHYAYALTSERKGRTAIVTTERRDRPSVPPIP